mmetsp:Transcript_50721/g.113996  ORF Transcript_50721/g.113996 Transcript_50721/m.113996 type:complete len:429 (+) Transcript_50721:257-1543(+)
MAMRSTAMPTSRVLRIPFLRTCTISLPPTRTRTPAGASTPSSRRLYHAITFATLSSRIPSSSASSAVVRCAKSRFSSPLSIAFPAALSLHAASSSIGPRCMSPLHVPPPRGRATLFPPAPRRVSIGRRRLIGHPLARQTEEHHLPIHSPPPPSATLIRRVFSHILPLISTPAPLEGVRAEVSPCLTHRLFRACCRVHFLHRDRPRIAALPLSLHAPFSCVCGFGVPRTPRRVRRCPQRRRPTRHSLPHRHSVPPRPRLAALFEAQPLHSTGAQVRRRHTHIDVRSLPCRESLDNAFDHTLRRHTLSSYIQHAPASSPRRLRFIATQPRHALLHALPRRYCARLPSACRLLEPLRCALAARHRHLQPFPVTRRHPALHPRRVLVRRTHPFQVYRRLLALRAAFPLHQILPSAPVRGSRSCRQQPLHKSH